MYTNTSALVANTTSIFFILDIGQVEYTYIQITVDTRKEVILIFDEVSINFS